MNDNRVFFYINNSTHILDLAGAVQAFYTAINYGIKYDIRFISSEVNQKSSTNLVFANLELFSDVDINPSDIVIIAGFSLKELPKGNRDLFSFLKKINTLKTTICSVCTGSFMLAEAGLLDNKECTTHWNFTEQLQLNYPKTKVLNNRLFVKNDNIYTSAGVTTGIDLALFLLEEKHGGEIAYQIAREMVVYMRRDGNESQKSIYLQYRQHINKPIHDVQDYIIHHLGEKITIEQLAELIFTSPRNLTRLFKATTGITIGNYLEELRVEKALQLLKDNNKMEFIAHSCGFKSTNQLRNILQKKGK